MVNIKQIIVYQQYNMILKDFAILLQIQKGFVYRVSDQFTKRWLEIQAKKVITESKLESLLHLKTLL